MPLLLEFIRAKLLIRNPKGIDKNTENILSFARKIAKMMDLRERPVWSVCFVLDRWAVCPCVFSQFAFRVFFFWSNFHISRRCNIDHFEIKPTIVRKVEGKCCGYGYTRLFPCHYLNWPGVPPSLRIPYLEVIWQSTQVFQSVKMGHLLYYFLCTGDWPTNHHFVWRNPREHHAASASQVMDWCVSAWIEESISIWHWK